MRTVISDPIKRSSNKPETLIPENAVRFYFDETIIEAKLTPEGIQITSQSINGLSQRLCVMPISGNAILVRENE